MRLDIEYLQYISKDEIRMLTAIEMGMRDHEWVPTTLIEKLSHLKRGVVHKILRSLGRQKLLQHNSKPYDSYQLNYHGYDYLALYIFLKRGYIKTIHRMIGSGKESDIYLCEGVDGNELILKLARLGRTSFRSIKNNRDYLQGRTHYSWLSLSKLSSLKEFLFMQSLYEHGFPTPKPIDSNRHAILMSLVPGLTLCKVKTIKNRQHVYDQAMDMIKKLCQYGLIHCDYNEFNLMMDDKEKLYVIDFPQMVSTSHTNADMYFQRDINCVKNLFYRKFHFVVEDEDDIEIPDFEVIKRLDVEIRASGSGNTDPVDFGALEEHINAYNDNKKKDGNVSEGSDEEEIGEEEENDEEEEEIDEEEEMVEEEEEIDEEEEMVEKRIKKNSAAMDIESDVDQEDEEEQEEEESAEPEVCDELAKAIAKEGAKHQRLMQLHKEKEEKMIKKVVHKKYKKKIPEKK